MDKSNDKYLWFDEKEHALFKRLVWIEYFFIALGLVIMVLYVSNPDIKTAVTGVIVLLCALAFSQGETAAVVKDMQARSAYDQNLRRKTAR